jgi:hypothetical protein
MPLETRNPKQIRKRNKAILKLKVKGTAEECFRSAQAVPRRVLQWRINLHLRIVTIFWCICQAPST